jgi:hypothetical protein
MKQECYPLDCDVVIVVMVIVQMVTVTMAVVLMTMFLNNVHFWQILNFSEWLSEGANISAAGIRLLNFQIQTVSRIYVN